MVNSNNRTKLLFVIFLAIFSELMFSCIDPLEIEISMHGYHLVVEGNVNDRDSIQKVTLSFTRQVTDEIIDPSAIHAEVRIIDDLGNYWSLQRIALGTYATQAGELSGQTGRAYAVEIKLADRIYTSAFEYLQPVPGIDSVYYTYKKDTYLDPILGVTKTDRYYQIYIDYTDPPGEKNYLIWHSRGTEEIWTRQGELLHICYRDEDYVPNQIYITNDRTMDGNFIKKYPVGRLNNDRPEPYLYVIEQKSISEEAFDYYTQIKERIEETGSIFDAPPEPIEGNLYCVSHPDEKVYGYFGAHAISVGKVLIPRYKYANGFQRPIRYGDCKTWGERIYLTPPEEFYNK